MELPLVIYHANCPDGFGAAVVAYSHFRQGDDCLCDFVPASFGQPPPEVTGRQVYILDFSYARPVLKTMCQAAQRVTIIDHHLSAEQALAGLEKEHANLQVVFDLDKSGAVLTWEFFHRQPPPRLLLHIQDRDLWQFALEGTNDLYAALQARPFDFRTWAALIDEGNLPASLFAEGEAINRYRHEMIAMHREKAVIGTVDGYQVPIVNFYDEIASDLLGELAEDHPFAVGYQDHGTLRKWSLRSSASGADVAQIATRFGGGGHRHAAGFITQLPEGLLHLSSQEPGKQSDAGQEKPDTNARRYQELEESKRLGDALNEIDTVLYSTQDYDAIMNKMLQLSTDVIGAESAVIFSKEEDRWMVRSEYKLPMSLFGQTFSNTEVMHTAITAGTKRSLVVQDVANSPEIDQKFVEMLGIRSLLDFPLIVRGEVIGDLTFHYHSSPVPFNVRQVEFARKLQISITLALENSRLLATSKQNESKLKTTEDKFAKAFQATPSVLVIASLADGRYKEVNEAFERVMGYRRNEVIGHSSLEFNIWENPEERDHVLRMLAEGKKIRDLEIGFRSKSGGIIVGLYSAEIIAIGAEQCLLSLVNDITARKKAEEALRHGEERYRRLYKETPVMLHSIDHDGRLVSVSNYWLQTLGYEKNEVLGRISTEFYTAASRSYATEVVLPEFFRTGSCKEVSYQMVKKNGEILDILLSAIAERDSEGKVVRSLAVSIDVTDRKRAEEEIARLNMSLAARAADLEDANRELEAFNYTVAHDLRTPLNTLSLSCQAIEMICGDQLNEECRDYLRNIYNSTLKMNELIDALLTFSSMSHVEPHREKIDLSVLAQEVVTMLQQTEPERQVDFRIADGIEANGDARLLSVVLNNLLGNAWKYTVRQEKAMIEFAAKVIDGELTYFVRDNGDGFDKSQAAKLFVPFQRLPGAETSKGFGIGLATVERIIQRHGGKIWAEGETGKGATFFFTLATN